MAAPDYNFLLATDSYKVSFESVQCAIFLNMFIIFRIMFFSQKTK